MRTRVSAIGALAAFLLVATGSAAADTRWAAPDGTGSSCSEAQPCSLEKAVGDAPNHGDEVIVTPGDYTISSQILASKALDIHGVYGESRPRLVAGSIDGHALNLASSGGMTTRLRHVEVQNGSVGGWAAVHLYAPAELSGVVLGSIGAGGRAAFIEGSSGEVVFRDSVARTTGNGGVAVWTSAGTLELRNVSAVSSGPGSTGIWATSLCVFDLFTCGPGSSATSTTAKNVIARGTQDDIAASSLSSTYPATVDIGHSNYRETPVGPGGFVNDQGGNQSAAPLFADEAGGDFHQLAGSPTIDAGTADPKNGATDLDGEARVVGSAPDIGADEFVPAPPEDAAGGTGGTGDGGAVGGADGTGDGGGPGGGGGALDTVAPVAGGLAVAPVVFRAARSGRSVLARRTAPVGTTVRYILSEEATVAFAVERKARGRRAGGRCVRRTARNRKGKRCTRHVPVRGSFSHEGAPGANAFRFTGRVNGSALRRGRYRLSGIPTDAAGNSGPLVRAPFRIAAPRRSR